ncbi:TetR/AcrR family transcriptional regulator [Jiangella alkaliphila]|uniref:DNA-binding transcriptional regulator, AcrR family n=1 Tax=Jiangella alkaliphila TaxID=419479 RepID=A0A1H2J5A4_9ACTN|nr:TetR/AcrR family transcriptional regulator [Jiangella alkaliphila]SDU51633.1 DNA-binding transcriptional regulator, AcrR family [Jiangella alkaliphila]
MHADVTEPATRTPSGPATRTRILTAANELFYAHGIRATSADRIIEQVGITKVTFYRHFRTKSELVVAYLEQQAAAERAWMQSVRRKGDAVGSLRALATDIGAASCRPGFRGCAFINAAAEYADPGDPVRVAVAAHRRWMLDEFAGIAAEAGVDDVDSAARQLMILRDGAMVNGYLGEASSVADALGAAFASVVTTAAPGPSVNGSP